jgi:signal transduction histidine kinase
VDAQCRVVAASEKFAALLGRTSADLVGCSFAGLFEACQSASIEAGIRALGSSESFSRTATLARDDQRQVAVHLEVQRAQYVPSGEGMTCAVVNTVPPRGEQRAANSPPRVQEISRHVLVAQELERQRIAADLHDGLGQLLGAVKFRAESALCALSRNDIEDARHALTHVASTVRQALDEVRRIAMNLRPSTLDDLGILATLSWFLREFRLVYATIDVQSELAVEEADIPDYLKVPIFRVVQEGMSNVAKHSQAKRARVSLRHAGGVLLLAIEDDGVGFEANEVAGRSGPDKRLGHSCSRERVESSGGCFLLQAAPGGGVRIAASWPMAATGSGRDHAGTVAHHDRRGPYAAAHRTQGAPDPGFGPPRRR